MSDIYCNEIIPGKLKVNIVKETENILAFEHTDPYWEKHIVIIPKKHIDSMSRIASTDLVILNELMLVAVTICKEVEKNHGGCRLVTNVGDYQSSKHLHFYVHGGERLRDESGSHFK